MEYLFVLAGGFALLFLISLIANKGKRTEHWILALLLLLITISCGYVFLLYHNNGQYYRPIFSEFNYAIPLLYGVCLWFYTRSLLTKEFKFRAIDALHLIPFFSFLIFLFLPLLLGERSEAPAQLGYPLIKLIINPIYIVYSLILLKEHRSRLLDTYSYVDHMHHYWLSWIAYGGLGLWLVACIGNVMNYVNNYDGLLLGDYFLTGFLALLLFILAYVGFNRTQVFQPAEKTLFMPKKSEPSPAQTVSTSERSIDSSELQAYRELEKCMVEKKPYLDPKLSLHKLSKIHQISSSRLSQIINSQSKTNFHDFVNHYRVEAVKKQLLTEDLTKYSIIGIAEDCGFNSKASFNRVFKKLAGMTPTQFVSAHAK